MTDTDPVPFDRAGKYVLGELLGVGGMAEVYRGSTVGPHGFTKKVAIKRVLAAFSANAAFSDMFINEARLAAMLNHPCVVAVLDFDRDPDGRLFQVIDYVDGVDLDKLLSPDSTTASSSRPPGPVLPVEIISYVLCEVLSGLEHAHTASRDGRPLGIIHRDCTPSNVFISWEGAVKLADFGVAKAMQATNATRSAAAKGKPAYMAPEQLYGAATMDGRVDLFAVGVMLYEMLTGYRPFAADTIEGLILAVADYGRGVIAIPSAYEATGGRAPEALSRFAARLMAAVPSERPANAHAALVELSQLCPPASRIDLARVLAQRWHNRAPRRAESPSYPVPTAVQVARAAPTVTSRGTVGHTPSPVGDLPVGAKPSPRRGVALAVGAVVLVIAASVTIVASSGGGDAPQSAATGAADIDAINAMDATTSTPVDAAVVDALAADALPLDASPQPDAPVARSVDAGPRRSPSSRPRPTGRHIIDTDLKGDGP